MTPKKNSVQKYTPKSLYGVRFSECNPLTDELPEQQIDTFQSTVLRCKRVLLADFIESQLIELADTIGELLSNPDFYRLVSKYGFKESDVKPIEPSEHEVRMLRQSVDKIDLISFCKNAKIQWHHVFTMMALYTVSDAIRQYQSELILRMKPRNPDFFSEEMRRFATLQSMYAKDALEAVTIAEELKGKLTITKDTLRFNAQKGGHKRHEDQDNVKEEFVIFYLQNSTNYKSRSTAAKIFYANLPQDKRKLFSSDNAVRTLVGALRTYYAKS